MEKLSQPPVRIETPDKSAPTFVIGLPTLAMNTRSNPAMVAEEIITL